MSNFPNRIKNSNMPKETPSSFIVKSKGKEVGANLNEEKKVKLFGDYKSFEFNLKVHGKSIFQNLILTVTATVNNEMIPVKCKWKRVNGETIIFIKDINSFSYMPTAEDIGYIIEVEVSPLDYPNETALGQYGPIELEKDIKNAIELLLTSGNANMSVRIYDTENQEKVANKEFKLKLNSDELTLTDINANGKETILEKCKYLPLNPIIKLNPCDPTRLLMRFFTFDYDDNEPSKIKQSNKREYNLVAESKLNRELIYLIIQFYIIDEKLKNNKLFSMINYNTLSSETKIGVTDLIGELKTLKEENKILMVNMKYLEHMNKKINEDFKDLEEDFQITLQKINAADMRTREEIDINVQKAYDKNKSASLIPGLDWKNKYEATLQLNTSLSAKEKALREEIKEYILQIEIDKNMQLKSNAEIKQLKEKINQLTGEQTSLNQALNIIKEKGNKTVSEKDKLLDEIESLKRQLNESNKKTEQVSQYTEKIEELEKGKETLVYENKNLIIQRNLLTNQKNDLAKAFEKIKNDKDKAEASLMQTMNQNEKLQLSIKEKDIKIQEASNNIHQTKNETNEYKQTIVNLQKDIAQLKEEANYGTKIVDMSQSMISNDPYVKIQREDYEEYDQLKRDKDETDAVILQLKSNNEGKTLEIEQLRKLIKEYEQK